MIKLVNCAEIFMLNRLKTLYLVILLYFGENYDF